MWPLWLLLLPFVAAINYRCQNDQVLVVQSFGNDTIRMHCQQLDLCGYQRLRCDYDDSQPNCGGQMNFVAHVNQKDTASPIEHTCCNLFNPRPPHMVPTHTGNDCFIYELPDGSSVAKPKEENPQDEPPLTVLKSASEIPEHIDGITGYRLRLFMLKNKAPPTLLVKGIERRLDGYRVTICRPKCSSYEAVGQEKEKDQAGEWKAISWSSWSASSWSSWAKSTWGNQNKGQHRSREAAAGKEGDAGKAGGDVNVNVGDGGHNENTGAIKEAGGFDRATVNGGDSMNGESGSRVTGHGGPNNINITVHTNHGSNGSGSGGGNGGSVGNVSATANANTHIHNHGNGNGSGDSSTGVDGAEDGANKGRKGVKGHGGDEDDSNGPDGGSDNGDGDSDGGKKGKQERQGKGGKGKNNGGKAENTEDGDANGDSDGTDEGTGDGGDGKGKNKTGTKGQKGGNKGEKKENRQPTGNKGEDGEGGEGNGDNDGDNDNNGDDGDNDGSDGSDGADKNTGKKGGKGGKGGKNGNNGKNKGNNKNGGKNGNGGSAGGNGTDDGDSGVKGKAGAGGPLDGNGDHGVGNNNSGETDGDDGDLNGNDGDDGDNGEDGNGDNNGDGTADGEEPNGEPGVDGQKGEKGTDKGGKNGEEDGDLLGKDGKNGKAGNKGKGDKSPAGGDGAGDGKPGKNGAGGDTDGDLDGKDGKNGGKGKDKKVDNGSGDKKKGGPAGAEGTAEKDNGKGKGANGADGSDGSDGGDGPIGGKKAKGKEGSAGSTGENGTFDGGETTGKGGNSGEVDEKEPSLIGNRQPNIPGTETDLGKEDTEDLNKDGKKPASGKENGQPRDKGAKGGEEAAKEAAKKAAGDKKGAKGDKGAAHGDKKVGDAGGSHENDKDSSSSTGKDGGKTSGKDRSASGPATTTRVPPRQPAAAGVKAPKEAAVPLHQLPAAAPAASAASAPSQPVALNKIAAPAAAAPVAKPAAPVAQRAAVTQNVAAPAQAPSPAQPAAQPAATRALRVQQGGGVAVDNRSPVEDAGGPQVAMRAQAAAAPTQQAAAAADPIHDPAPAADPIAAMKKMNCFSADTQVTTVTGKKRMDELQVGDHILVPSSDNVLKYERVEMFYHRQPDTVAQFTVLFTSAGKRMALTPLHLIPVGECSQMNEYLLSSDGVSNALGGSRFAQNAQVGQCVLTVNEQGQLIADKIKKIGRQVSKGIYSPMTVEGAVIADGMLASCFSQLESHSVQKAVFDFLMYFNDFFGMGYGSRHEFQGIPSFISYVHELSHYVIPFAKY